jgi:type I restriction enzyme S subunit
MTLCDRLEAQHGDAADAHEKLVSHLLGTLTQSQSAADFNTNWQRIASHFDTLFTTEASIDALKQTLLQLAVMGKLVAQDANDEPASQLLKHIQAEKAKLIAEGKIKKDRLFVPSVERENPYTIPRSWKWVTLDEISQVGTGATPLRTTFEYYNPPSISWVTSGETSHSFISETEQYVSALALQETNLTVYPRGTLIVAMYGQGKTRGQITELMIEACTNQACAAIQLYSDIESHRKYVKLFFEKIYDEIRELAAGGAQPNLNLSKIKETLLPLPPLSEQYRIVVKIDELMNICDRLRLCITYAKQQQQKLADVLVAHAVM